MLEKLAAAANTPFLTSPQTMMQVVTGLYSLNNGMYACDVKDHGIVLYYYRNRFVLIFAVNEIYKG